MLGFGTKKKQIKSSPVKNDDVAKLFFDTFSNRLTSLESILKGLSSEIERLRFSGDQSKLSDLVLLERLQKTEKLLYESLGWIKQVAEAVATGPRAPVAETKPQAPSTVISEPPRQSTVEPTILTNPSLVQPGSLNSITTPTELQVLTLLASEGPKSAPEIGKHVGRSREHTARLMKKLFDEGYVRRDQSRIPFRYSTVERVKQSLTKPLVPGQEEEAVSAPPA